MSERAAGERLDRVFREEHGALVGGLLRRFGDVELAEDAVAEAYAEAAARWPRDGVPAAPAAWLALTARNKALDRVRRETGRRQREEEGLRAHRQSDLPIGVVDDDRLRLLFMCAHPALAPDVRVALTLRLVGGLSMPEIAAAFLVDERTMAQRLTRAKRKIKDTAIPFRIPQSEDVAPRLDAVLTAVYLVYNEGYLSRGTTSALRDDLCAEAVRLARMLVAMLPDAPEPAGLLALLLLTQARREARVDADGLVLLDEQDRSSWDGALLAEGLCLATPLLDGWVGRTPTGRYQLMAVIAATHAAATTAAEVDRTAIRSMYDLLLEVDPSPVVALNRALAGAPVHGDREALAELDGLGEGLAAHYHPWHVARAHLLRRLGRTEEARQALVRALHLATNPLEVAHLRADLDRLGEAIR